SSSGDPRHQQVFARFSISTATNTAVVIPKPSRRTLPIEITDALSASPSQICAQTRLCPEPCDRRGNFFGAVWVKEQRCVASLFGQRCNVGRDGWGAHEEGFIKREAAGLEPCRYDYTPAEAVEALQLDRTDEADELDRVLQP